MPLIDAYISLSGISGSYKASHARGSRAKLELPHDGWSEITEFNYDIDDSDYPNFIIKKPIDAASNKIYLALLKNRSRDTDIGGKSTEPIIKKIIVHLCRWVNTSGRSMLDITAEAGVNAGFSIGPDGFSANASAKANVGASFNSGGDSGGEQQLQVFLEYIFEQCRIQDYRVDIDFEADDLPEETVKFGFRAMTMHYFLANKTDPSSDFTWDYSVLEGSSPSESDSGKSAVQGSMGKGGGAGGMGRGRGRGKRASADDD